MQKNCTVTVPLYCGESRGYCERTAKKEEKSREAPTPPYIIIVLTYNTYSLKKKNSGLAQPIANWAKDTESVLGEQRSVSEVDGNRFRLLLGQCMFIAPGRSVCIPPLSYSLRFPPIVEDHHPSYSSRSLSPTSPNWHTPRRPHCHIGTHWL